MMSLSSRVSSQRQLASSIQPRASLSTHQAIRATCPLHQRIEISLNVAAAGHLVKRPSISCAATATPSRAFSPPGQSVKQVNVVYKFGGSSVRDAERMMEVADIICSFPQYLPCVVLSAMGKTTNLLLECGDLALETPTDQVPNLAPLQAIRKLHLETCDTLGVEPAVRSEVEKLLSELSQLLIGISIMQVMTLSHPLTIPLTRSRCWITSLHRTSPSGPRTHWSHSANASPRGSSPPT
jgi:hypothetical protein